MRFYLLSILLLFPAIAMGEDIEMQPPIKAVKAQYEKCLLKLPGVISVGIGRDENGQPTIIVGLERPNPETEAKLPSQLEGYPLRVRIVGRIKAQ
jgi:hypothetical protein